MHVPHVQAVEKQLNEPTGNKLDAYEIEATHEKADVLRDLAEFHLASVSHSHLLLEFSESCNRACWTSVSMLGFILGCLMHAQ